MKKIQLLHEQETSTNYTTFNISTYLDLGLDAAIIVMSVRPNKVVLKPIHGKWYTYNFEGWSIFLPLFSKYDVHVFNSFLSFSCKSNILTL